MRVLVAEDDPVSRLLLTKTLEGLKHEPLVAWDGHEAWERFIGEPVDVVITDWMMPRVDGLELTRRIRARARERYTWVLLLTALHGKERYLDGMDAGADDFMSKPLDRQELQVRLRVAERILSLQQEVRQLEGLLPICSYCKKIRDELDRWSQVEDYVSRHTEAQFSHGICPDCYERHLKPQLENAQMINGIRAI
ncbi:MAG TPA: response regulator transcription factor [Gemmatimonadales bacterium]|nr:response regulator transcription factor [Gemmatimonadales bacterium]